MRDSWAYRPYITRLQLAGALLVSVITLVDIIIFFVGARRLHSSVDVNLCVLTFTVIVFALGAGAIQGHRAVSQARSTLDIGDSNAALTMVSRQFFIIVVMAGAGCLAIIVSIVFLIELLTRR